MAKLKQATTPILAKTPVFWRLYPVAWCLIGISAGTYIFTSETSSKITAFLSSDTAVMERRVADSEMRASTAARALDRAKSDLREERSRVVALNIRIDKLTSELRAANAAPLKVTDSDPAGPGSAAPRSSTQTADAGTQPQAVRTTVVNTTPVTGPDTSRLVTVNATPPAVAVAAVIDPNAPPLPVRVPAQARIAALAAARPTTSQITTGSVATRPAEQPKAAERAPSEQTTTATNVPSQWNATPAPAGSNEPPATVAAGASNAALRLATAPSITSLRQSWAVLTSRHPDILQGLNPRYRDITTSQGRTFQLIAGPLLSRGEAIQLCAMLQVQAVGCGVDNFAGVPL